MSVQITPDLLTFNAPYTQEQKVIDLTIANNSEETIAFKVKTTTPQKYCVKPNSAVLQAKSSQVVQIVYLGNDNDLLQAHDPKIPYVCKDKFLVQTLPCPYEFEDIHKGWSSLESEFKGLLEAKKIRVKFDFEEITESKSITKEKFTAEKLNSIPESVTKPAEKAVEAVSPQVTETEEQEKEDIVKEIIEEKTAEDEEKKKEEADEVAETVISEQKVQSGPDFIAIFAVVAVIAAAIWAYKNID
ncbi:hypothetical protein QEN19_003425 [Hanseniaspora menglaensis]